MSADFLPPDPNSVNIPQPAPEPALYERPIDRILIRIGELFTRYFTLIAFAVGFVVICGLVAVGGLFMVYEVGERFNELEIKNHQKQIFLEQQLEKSSEIDEPESSKQADESDWFIVVDETEPLSAETDPADASLDEAGSFQQTESADGSQQFVKTDEPESDLPVKAIPEEDLTVIN